MSNHLYGYDPSAYGAASSSARNISSIYNYGGLSDPSMYYDGYSAATSHLTSSAAASINPYSAAGLKRSSEALYHPTALGAHNPYGQTDTWHTDHLAKRPRFESASTIQIYPQRPGEKDCAHYMQTRTCMYGDSCKFDHPLWVPEGGIPEWKEVSLVTTENLPEKPGEPDCPYYMKTQKCMYGVRCKFNHPKDSVGALGAPGSVGVSSLPERPSEPPCAFYLKTGTCKFGGTCKFHHPKDIQILSVGQDDDSLGQVGLVTPVEIPAADVESIKPSFQVTPALSHNSKGLPIRLGEVDCPFYLKTGSCKYGATCRYSHPDIGVVSAPVAAIGHSYVTSQTPSATLNLGLSNFGTLQSVDSRLATSMLGYVQTIYPQRPGQMECDFYMKTGICKFGERCRFHHPYDRTAPAAKVEDSVKLTLAGFPRREGAIICPYYLKTGTCKYGPTCKFDHPPPGEAMAMATSQGAAAASE